MHYFLYWAAADTDVKLPASCQVRITLCCQREFLEETRDETGEAAGGLSLAGDAFYIAKSG